MASTDAFAEPPTVADRTAQLKQLAKSVTRRTSRLRGLRRRRAVRMAVMTRAQIVQHVEKKLKEEYTDQEIADEAAVLKVLGLLPAKLDYRKTVLALLKEQVAGFYDPKTRRLNMADWLSAELQEPALAHEICHALQDQHFNLRRLIKPQKNNSDQQLARAALVEGDCTGVMVEYVLRKQGLDLGSMPDAMGRMIREGAVGKSDAFRAAPAYLRETLMFPYVRGLEMIQRIRSRHPWRQVNVMYKRPPKSTEQILHYDKYWKRERPIRIRGPKSFAALEGYRVVKQDVLGELQLSVYLSQGVSAAAARRAAAGWGGDLLLALRKQQSNTDDGKTGDVEDGKLLVVHVTSWDSDGDAREYANSQRHVLKKQGLKAQPSTGGSWSYLDSNGAHWSVQLHKSHVLSLMAVPAELHALLSKEVWAKSRIGGKRVTPTAAGK